MKNKHYKTKRKKDRTTKKELNHIVMNNVFKMFLKTKIDEEVNRVFKEFPEEDIKTIKKHSHTFMEQMIDILLKVLP